MQLVGRVSAGPESRTMPSGDELVQLRVVVPRPKRRGDPRNQVDAIDVACWSARSRASALRLERPGAPTAARTGHQPVRNNF